MSSALYNLLKSGHLVRCVFSCIPFKKFNFRLLKKCDAFFFSNRKHIACCLNWALCHWGGEVWEKLDRRVLWGRQEHLHTAETGDWRSIIRFSAVTLNRCVPVNQWERAEREPDSTPATFASTSAPFHLSEQQRNNDQQRINNERKANLLFQIYLSFSSAATLWSKLCSQFWAVVWTSLTKW